MHRPRRWVSGGETAVQVVYDCMRVMGVTRYDGANHPLDMLMRDVLCIPIYDTGNIGTRHRNGNASTVIAAAPEGTRCRFLLILNRS